MVLVYFLAEVAVGIHISAALAGIQDSDLSISLSEIHSRHSLRSSPIQFPLRSGMR